MTNSDEMRRQWIVRDEAFLVSEFGVEGFEEFIRDAANEAGIELERIDAPLTQLIIWRLRGFDVNIAGFLGALRIEGYKPLEVGGQFNDGGGDERAYRD